jgi:hypothetical protein
MRLPHVTFKSYLAVDFEFIHAKLVTRQTFTGSNRLAAHSKLLSNVFLIDASGWAQLAIRDWAQLLGQGW